MNLDSFNCFFGEILSYILNNKNLIIEIIGTITGLFVVLLQYRASHWFAVVGSISSALYIYIFYHSKFYADAVESIYYLGANLYALFFWLYLKKKHQNKNYGGITRVGKTEALILFAIFLIAMFAIRYILKTFTDSPVATGDAMTTAMSIVAMWLLARKNIEHWLVWTALNAISTGLYVWKGLYSTTLLYGTYTIISILGYLKWKKEMIKFEVHDSMA